MQRSGLKQDVLHHPCAEGALIRTPITEDLLQDCTQQIELRARCDEQNVYKPGKSAAQMRIVIHAAMRMLGCPPGVSEIAEAK